MMLKNIVSFFMVVTFYEYDTIVAISDPLY